jgi:hypothetical protein
MMFPYDMLPNVAARIAQLLPATQAMNAFSGLAMGGVADFNPRVPTIALCASGALACCDTGYPPAEPRAVCR